MSTNRIAIDLGTSNTKIYQLGGGVVLSEPSVVAVSSSENKAEIKAIGLEAKKLIGKTSENTKIVFPIFEGEVVNEKLATAMLKSFLTKIKYKQGFSAPIVAASVPCGAELPLIKKLRAVFVNNGFTAVSFVETPILSAIGQNIPLNEASPCFVIDMGGGVTNISALSLDGIIAGISVSLGGKNIDTALIDFIADNYGLQIGLLTAERIKIQIGSLLPNDTLSTVVNGRDLDSGRPRSVVLKAEEIAEPIIKYYDKIFDLATSVLSKLPPEVSAEIRKAGIYLSGGTASIVGLESYYRKKFNMNINMPTEPTLSVINGLGMLIGNTELLNKVRISEL